MYITKQLKMTITKNLTLKTENSPPKNNRANGDTTVQS